MARYTKYIVLIALIINMISLGILLVDKDKVKDNQVMFETRNDKGLLIIEDSKLWNYLDEKSPRFDFDTLEKQYFLFDKKVEPFLKSIENRKGNYVHFPPVDENILPYGLTLMFEGVEYNKDVVKVWVRTTEEVKLLTEKDLKELEQKLKDEENKQKLKDKENREK